MPTLPNGATARASLDDDWEDSVNWTGLVFLIVVVVGSLIGVGRLQLRERHNNPMKAWVRSQSPTFSTKALVRQRASGGNGLGWGTYKSPAGSQLIIRGEGIGLPRSPIRLDKHTGSFFGGAETTMWIDHVGFAGTSVGSTECIRLFGRDLNGKVDLAIRPTCSQGLAGRPCSVLGSCQPCVRISNRASGLEG